MLKIGITGGIGSGKTTVCHIFEILGVPVYYADDRAKKLMTGNKEVKDKIIKLFGQDAYFKNGRLNRKEISKIVFKNKEILNRLNQIVHPAVSLDFETWSLQHKSEKYILKEAALLIESGSYKTLDKLVLVTADIDVRIKRVIERDKSTKEKVTSRMNAQMPEEEKGQYANYKIDNSGYKSLIQQVINLHHQFIEL